MVRKMVVTLLCLAAPAAHAHDAPLLPLEVTAFYGKGVSHNPNADMSAYALSWASGRVFGWRTRAHLITGEVFGDAQPRPDGAGGSLGGGGARPFKLLGYGKELRYNWRAVECRAGIGYALVSRTADAAEYAGMPYYLAGCGVAVRGLSMGFARFHGAAAGLTDPWDGRPYDAPSFQGAYVSLRFNIQR